MGAEKARGGSLPPARTRDACFCHAPSSSWGRGASATRAGSDDESASASPGCSDEEQGTLAKLMPFVTLVDPGTMVALLSASVEDFDAEAMALTEPAGTFTLSFASADADCMVAIRPRSATNITLAFSPFEDDTFSYLRVYDGLSIAAPLIA